MIAPDWLLTCAHCGQATIAGGLEVTNTYIAPGGSVDMALMRVPGLTAKWYPPIAAVAPALHDDLHAYGWHLGTQLLMTDGHQGKDSDEMSCPIIHGCSGGAVVNSSGELVGALAMTEPSTGWAWLPGFATRTPPAGSMATHYPTWRGILQ